VVRNPDVQTPSYLPPNVVCNWPLNQAIANRPALGQDYFRSTR